MCNLIKVSADQLQNHGKLENAVLKKRPRAFSRWIRAFLVQIYLKSHFHMKGLT